MGSSASQKVQGGVSRPGGHPSKDSFQRPTGANADGAPTVRNIIPWKDMEKKVAERLAAKAAAGELDGDAGEKDSPSVPPSGRPPSSKGPPPWKTDVEPAPDSGVRSSVNSPGADLQRPLTYSVYTVAELAARGETRSPRTSAFPPPLAPQPYRWADVARSGVSLVRVWWTCVRSPKPRPPVLDVCRVPFQSFKTELATALKALPWKKVGIGVGIAFGSLFLLLFIVLTAAELTDDLKPARTTSSTSTASPGTTAIAAPAPVAEPDPAPAIELDDDAPAAATPAPKPKPKPKKPMMKKY